MTTRLDLPTREQILHEIHRAVYNACIDIASFDTPAPIFRDALIEAIRDAIQQIATNPEEERP